MVMEPDVGSGHSWPEQAFPYLDISDIAAPTRLLGLRQWRWGADLDQAVQEVVVKGLLSRTGGHTMLISGLNLAIHGGVAAIPTKVEDWTNPLINLAQELVRVDWVVVTAAVDMEDPMPWTEGHLVDVAIQMARSLLGEKEMHHTPKFLFWLIRSS